MTIEDLLKQSHEVAVNKGWWDLPVVNGEVQEPDFGKLIALAHSELSEALEEWRDGRSFGEIYHNGNKEEYWHDGNGWVDGKPMGIAIEFADLFIRIADTCAALKIPLESAIREKMEFNRTRPYRHGRKRA